MAQLRQRKLLPCRVAAFVTICTLQSEKLATASHEHMPCSLWFKGLEGSVLRHGCSCRLIWTCKSSSLNADNLMAAILGISLATSLQRVRYQGYVQHGIQFESAHRGANCNTLHQAMQVVNLNLVDPRLQHTGYESSTSFFILRQHSDSASPGYKSWCDRTGLLLLG